MPPIIEAAGLTKRFGRVEALRGLDLVAEHGQVLALLAPNGAGKTTFVRSVATLIRPDSGTLRVAGHDALRDPARVRRVIGLTGQHVALEPALTGRENLEMIARLYGQSRRRARSACAAVLDQLGQAEAADRRVSTYSGGMRRILDLGASLVNEPALLLLDEPTTGLDPRARMELWKAIRLLVTRGTDVLLTTQYLDEADQLADRIVVIDHGRVIASGTPTELKAKAGRDVIVVHVADPADVPTAGAALARIGEQDPHTDQAARLISLPVAEGTLRLTDAITALAERGVAVEDIALRRPTLDEVFLSLTGHPAEAIDEDDSGTPAADRVPEQVAAASTRSDS
jgi:ABC-2 type transport system ATP-binding protein